MADYSVTFSELDALLQSLPANTVDTPYEIEITEITNAQCGDSSTSGTLGRVLRSNSTKFVALSFSEDSGLTEMGEESFDDADTLIKISIPVSVTSILRQAFSGSSKLKQIEYKGTLSQYCNITFGSSVFREDLSGGVHDLVINGEVVDILEIPTNITAIKNNSFSSFSFTKVVLHNSVTTIGNRAFLGCDLLSEINLPNSISSIADAAFMFCSSLTEITIPSSITTIPAMCFRGTPLKNLTIPDNITLIGSAGFRNCTELETISLSSNLTEIKGYAFYKCTSLNEISIPSSVTEIGNYAFAENTSYMKIEFLHNFNELHLTLPTSTYDIFKNTLPSVHLKDPATKGKFYVLYRNKVSVYEYVADSDVSEVEADDLSSALGYLYAETTSAPNRINVTKLEASHLIGADTATSGTVQYDLQQNSTKYVQLEETPDSFEETITSLQKCFKNCTNLVGFTGIPRSVTNISEAFSGCTNLNTVEWEEL